MGQCRYDSNNREVTGFAFSDGGARIAALGYKFYRILKAIPPVELPLQWRKARSAAKAYAGTLS